MKYSTADQETGAGLSGAQKPNSPGRRKFIRSAGVGAAALGLSARRSLAGEKAAAVASSRSGKGRGKPNLLFLWTDQQRPDTLAAYGNRQIKTPHLNALAKESIAFENAYVTQPVCTPSRSSIMSGLWPHQNGCVRNNIPLPESTRCLPEWLDDPDYRTGYMGKWHLGDEIFAQHGFENWVSIEDNYIEHYREGRDLDRRSDYHNYLRELGYEPDRRNSVFSREFATRLPLEECKPAYLQRRAQDFLRSNRNDPFILSVNFLEPHTPFFGPLNELHESQKLDLPGNWNDPLEENEPLRYRLRREKMRFEAAGGNDDQFAHTSEHARTLLARYYGLMAQVDSAVGGILQTLSDLGLDESTLVVFTSDHGEMMGSHGTYLKSVFYEESARVPFLLRLPRGKRRAGRIANPVSHIDLLPTMLDFLGSDKVRDAIDSLPGRSLLPRIRDEESWDKHVFSEWHAGNRDVFWENTELTTTENAEYVCSENSRMVVSADGWKLVRRDRDLPQLFNLRKDPLETINILGRSENRSTIKELDAVLQQWQSRNHDDLELDFSL